MTKAFLSQSLNAGAADASQLTPPAGGEARPFTVYCTHPTRFPPAAAAAAAAAVTSTPTQMRLLPPTRDCPRVM